MQIAPFRCNSLRSFSGNSGKRLHR
jgi:hypothetical protein